MPINHLEVDTGLKQDAKFANALHTGQVLFS